MIRNDLREVEADREKEFSKKISPIKRKNIRIIVTMKNRKAKAQVDSLNHKNRSSLKKLHSKYAHAIWISSER